MNSFHSRSLITHYSDPKSKIQNPNMSQKNSPPPIVFITLGLLLFGGGHWLLSNKSSKLQESVTVTRSQTSSLQDRISNGEKMLIQSEATSEKKNGIDALAKGNDREAIAFFEKSLQTHRNDPETLIYLNNAKVGDNALKIAISVPISSNLNVAQEMLRGAAQAQDEINRNGGINGTGLKIQIVDDGNDPEIAKQVAAELVQDARVLAVVGHNASDASLAAAPIYQQEGLVMVTPTSFANNLSGFGSYIFRTVPNIRFMADLLADYAANTARKPNVAVCYDARAQDNLSFKDEFVASLVAKGGKLVPLVCDFSSPTFNANDAIAQAVSSGADAMLLSPHVDRLDRAIELARANRGQLTLLSSPTLYTIKTLESGQSDVSGLVLPVPWHPATFANNPFASHARQTWGGAVNWRTATAYDATRAIIAGLQQNDTRQGLQSALRSPNFLADGSGEKIKFLPTGDRASTPILVRVESRASGYDFVPMTNSQ
jgi:branched-chain amino acid transport system substrate-binding protein